MRIRTIKPEFWQDEKLGVESDALRLAFAWTWSEADDSGVLRLSPGALRSGMWQHQDRTLAEAQAIIERMVSLGLLVCWSDGSATYAAVVHFHDHQRIDHPGKTRHPEVPTEILASLSDKFRDGYTKVSRECRESVARVSSESRPRARVAVAEEPGNRGTGEPSIRGTEEEGKEDRTPPCPTDKDTPRKREGIRLTPDGDWEGISEEQRSLWQRNYPGISLDEELRKARAWAQGDWAKRKKIAWGRFLSTWFSKSQDRASSSSAPRSDRYNEAEQTWTRINSVINGLSQTGDGDAFNAGVEVLDGEDATKAALSQFGEDTQTAVYFLQSIGVTERARLKHAFVTSYVAAAAEVSNV